MAESSRASLPSVSFAPASTANNAALADFVTYEDYLDSQILPDDRKYLQSDDLMRALVELGYRGSGETLKRDEFEARKQSSLTNTSNSHQTPKLLTHVLAKAINPFKPHSLLAALAEREESLRTGKLSSILFLRERNARGQEVSGYIDIAERMKNEDFTVYFSAKKKLSVKVSDLSYYNWDTGMCASNNSANFQVKVDEHEKEEAFASTDASTNAHTAAGASGGHRHRSFLSAGGLMFKNKRDRKLLSVDPEPIDGELDGEQQQQRRVVVSDRDYIQCVIYDHVTRRKS